MTRSIRRQFHALLACIVVLGLGTAVAEGEHPAAYIATFVTLVVAVVLGRSFRRNVLDALDALRAASVRLAAGDFSTPLAMPRLKELAELNEAFATMTLRLGDNRSELLAKERQMKAIVDTARTAFFSSDQSGAILEWNSEAQRIFGCHREDVIGRDLTEVISPSALAAENRAELARAMVNARDLERENVEIIGMRQDGSEFRLGLSAWTSWYDETPTFHAFAFNIDERRELEEGLRASEQRFRSLVQHSSDLILVCDSEGILGYVSPAATNIVGIADADLLGRSVIELIVDADQEQTLEALRQVRSQEASDTTSLTVGVQHADGSVRWVEGTFTNLLGEAAVLGIVVNFRDVSDRHRLEGELRHAQKLESVGQLAAGIAHEINTPIQFVGDNVRFLKDAFADLNGVLGCYREAAIGVNPLSGLEEANRRDTAADSAFLMAEVPEAIDQTLEGIDRVATIVRAMKVFGHPGGEEMAPTDLNDAIKNTLVVAHNEYKYVADVVTELGSLPPVWCHVGDINQVILNLLVNAAHAIGDTGTRGTITLTTRLDEDFVVLDIADTGTGIPEDVLGRIFDPFFTTKAVGRGTGQGLALAHALIHERHRGTISVATSVGTGTVFSLRLPLAPTGTDALALKDAV